jgi:hypothetical protein
MGQIAKLTPVAILVLALMASLGGCDRSHGSAPPSAAGDYITMAMQSSEGQSWGLSLFPKTAGTDKCVIHAGFGPGLWVPSICTTSVILRRSGEATVRFVQRWNARRFHTGPGQRGQLSHTWELTVSRNVAGERVVESRDYGDFPPQLVRRPPSTSNPNLAPPHANGGNIRPPLGV